MSILDTIKGFFGKKAGGSSEKRAVPAKEPAAKAGAKPAPAKVAAPAAPAALSPELAALLPGPPPGGKIKLAIYWGASCGGCDVSILDTDMKVLTIGDMADIVFWPLGVDGKISDVEALEDGEITVTLFNGAIRNSENEEVAHLLRKKSALMVAYGSCAVLGGMPGLANTSNTKEILDYVYTKTPTMPHFQKTQKSPVIPQTLYKAPEGDLTLPVLYDTVKTLDQILDVDYYVPGCPPKTLPLFNSSIFCFNSSNSAKTVAASIFPVLIIIKFSYL